MSAIFATRGFLGVSTARWLAAAAIVLGLGVASVFVRNALSLEWSVASLRDLVARAGWWGPALYIGILTFRFAVLIPSTILLTAAGICFGGAAGTLYATIGLTFSALLKFGVASVVGRDLLLRQLPRRWRDGLAVGDQAETAGGLGLICAYPFGPKHIFEIAAILAGISLLRYTFAVFAGSAFRAGAFAFFGDAIATGEGVVATALVLLAVGLLPLAVPSWRRWLLARARPA